ncbi:MAG: hypothetical protein EKK46_00825 [Rhodocyclaceae bacterium]|nr:MAG: hypothetical protein EKK46_00825 [Rhodocyclaceae bacterium]
MVRLLLVFIALLWTGLALADEAVDICFNYGCASHAQALIAESRLNMLRDELSFAANPEQERALLSLAMGRLYGWAGEQTPIHVDKGGNYADEGEPGSMDCIDHSLTTERFLHLLEDRHMLHFHRVVGRVKRVRFLIMEHNAVEIAELSGAAPHYVVDSWYVDNGKPAVILPLQNWMDGEGPDV